MEIRWQHVGLAIVATALKSVHLASASEVTASSSDSMASEGSAGCRCIQTLPAGLPIADVPDASGASPSLTVDLSHRPDIVVAHSGGVFNYPLHYGLGSCRQWDQLQPPDCASPNGTMLPDPAPWCSMQWCWVDPAECDQADAAGSSYFPDSGAFYSCKMVPATPDCWISFCSEPIAFPRVVLLQTAPATAQMSSVDGAKFLHRCAGVAANISSLSRLIG